MLRVSWYPWDTWKSLRATLALGEPNENDISRLQERCRHRGWQLGGWSNRILFSAQRMRRGDFWSGGSGKTRCQIIMTIIIKANAFKRCIHESWITSPSWHRRKDLKFHAVSVAGQQKDCPWIQGAEVLYGAGHICKNTLFSQKTIRCELTLDVSKVAPLCLAYLSSRFHTKARLCLLSFQTRVAMLQTGKDQLLLQKAGGKNRGVFSFVIKQPFGFVTFQNAKQSFDNWTNMSENGWKGMGRSGISSWLHGCKKTCLQLLWKVCGWQSRIEVGSMLTGRLGAKVDVNKNHQIT